MKDKMRKVNRKSDKPYFRSSLEAAIFQSLQSKNKVVKYEHSWVPYTVPASEAKYLPDFILPKVGGGLMFLEVKGGGPLYGLTLSCRKKHLLVKEQNPEMDLRFVFFNSKLKIRAGSKTSYGDWCDKYGFLYCDKEIPKEWLKEIKEWKGGLI